MTQTLTDAGSIRDEEEVRAGLEEVLALLNDSSGEISREPDAGAEGTRVQQGGDAKVTGQQGGGGGEEGTQSEGTARERRRGAK